MASWCEERRSFALHLTGPVSRACAVFTIREIRMSLPMLHYFLTPDYIGQMLNELFCRGNIQREEADKRKDKFSMHNENRIATLWTNVLNVKPRLIACLSSLLASQCPILTALGKKSIRTYIEDPSTPAKDGAKPHCSRRTDCLLNNTAKRFVDHIMQVSAGVLEAIFQLPPMDPRLGGLLTVQRARANAVALTLLRCQLYAQALVNTPRSIVIAGAQTLSLCLC